VRFQVLTAASMMFRIIFWDVLPCKMIVGRRFRGAYCLHHQGWVRVRAWWWWRQYAPLKRLPTIILHGSTSQKIILNTFKQLCPIFKKLPRRVKNSHIGDTELEGSLPCPQIQRNRRVLSHMNPIHILTSYFCKIYLSLLSKSEKEAYMITSLYVCLSIQLAPSYYSIDKLIM
jgi:hypothetical protein